MRLFKFVLGFCFLNLLLLQLASSFPIYRVGEPLVGYEFDEAWQQWFKKEMTIWAGSPEKNKTTIFFRAETKLGAATIELDGSADIKQKLNEMIAKALRWTKIAQTNQANTEKVLGCFGQETTNCKTTGIPDKKGQFGLLFFSADKGKQINLIINIADKNKENTRGSLYFDPSQIQKLFEITQKITTSIMKGDEAQTLFRNPQDPFN